jgi:hypothetical protein
MPKLTAGLFKVYTRLDGAKFRGHLTTSGLVTSKEKAPYRVLHVRRPSFIAAGDVISTPGGEHIILLEHPDDFDWATTFKASYAKDKLAWSRPVKVEDPVARVVRDIAYQSMGDLYVNFDTPSELKVEGLSGTEYRFIAGSGVLVDDKVGDKIVKRVVESLGVQIVYAI